MRTSCLFAVIAVSFVGEFQAVPILPTDQLLGGATSPLSSTGANVPNLASQATAAPGLVKGLVSTLNLDGILTKRDGAFSSLPVGLPGLGNSLPVIGNSPLSFLPSSPGVGNFDQLSSFGSGAPGLSGEDPSSSVGGLSGIDSIPVAGSILGSTGGLF